MYYAVENFYKMLDDGGIDPLKVKEVTYIWGEGDDDDWYGGCCFEMDDGEYFILERRIDGSLFMDTSLDQPFPPTTDDFIEYPGDIHSWLSDGASLEDVHYY